MNIKEKILALPLTAHRKIFTPQGIRQQCAEVAQEYVDRIELGHKFNLEAVQEACAGLEQQLLAERKTLIRIDMNITEKIMAIPNPYEDISRDGSHMFEGYERGVADSAGVAQKYVKELELAEKYNFKIIQEINARLEQQLLAEREKMKSKKAYCKSVFSDGEKQIQKHKNNIEALIAEIDGLPVYHFHEKTEKHFINLKSLNAILDKYRSKLRNEQRR